MTILGLMWEYLCQQTMQTVHLGQWWSELQFEFFTLGENVCGGGVPTKI